MRLARVGEKDVARAFLCGALFDVGAAALDDQRAEKIVFAKVYRETLTMSEGEKANLIAFSGRSFSTAPAVSRV